MCSERLVPLVLLLATPSALAGVWVGTPVGVRLAPTDGVGITRAELDVLPPVLTACSGPDLVLHGVEVIDASDAFVDLEIPAGCWTELRVPVLSAKVGGAAAAGAFEIDLTGFTVVVPLGANAAGARTLELGGDGWLAPVLPELGPQTLYVDPQSPLGMTLRDGLAAEATLW